MKRFLKVTAVFFAFLLCLCLTACNEDAVQQIENALVPAVEQALVNELESALSIGQQAEEEDALEEADLPVEDSETDVAEPEDEETDGVVYGNDYSTPEEVAAYLNEFHELPPNYITKSEAMDMGWESSEGNLYEVTGGLSIGGDYFSNYQKALPTAHGRKYYECDVNYYGGYRGAERLVYSNDGLIYYTGDHYNTFTLLYGEE